MSWRFLSDRRSRCPPSWKLSRAFSDGASPELALHMRRCSSCHDQWVAMEQVTAVADSLPEPILADSRKEQLGAQLLNALSDCPTATHWPGSRRMWALLASAVVTGGLLWLLGHRHTVVASSAASIHAIGAATFARMRPLPDELVRLESGTLQVDVLPLEHGQRLRIATGDAELETVDGLLDVSAIRDQLVAVRIWRGHVELRAASFHLSLRAGDQWSSGSYTGNTAFAIIRNPLEPSSRNTPIGFRDPDVPSVPSVAASDRTRRRGNASSVRVGSATVSHEERAAPRISETFRTTEPQQAPPGSASREPSSFERGWFFLRSGYPSRAVDAFREALHTRPDDGLQEDTVFWLGVAEVRAGQSLNARNTLSMFISRFPNAARSGEASAMLGWLLIDCRDFKGAKNAFQGALNDPVDSVRSSAEKGLQHIVAERHD